LAEALCEDPGYAGAWNYGPAPEDARPVRWVADRLAALWPGVLRWELDPGSHPTEATHLSLDSSKARERLGWAPAWGLDEALARIVEWYRDLRAGGAMREVTRAQIAAFAAAGSVAA
jgi:CDP-glucose 4,6-dehydratase